MSFLTSITLCAFLFLASATSSQAIEQPDRPSERQTIELERFRKALWTVKVTLNGKTGHFLLDTGGGNTMVTERFASDWDCTFRGRMTGYNMFGERIDSPLCEAVDIRAGAVRLTRVNAGKIDFSNRFPADATPDGLLSLDAFDGKAITLDQANATLIIESPASLQERISHMIELPLRVSRECSAKCLSIFLGVPRPDGMTWLTLDSGAGGVSLIAKEYAEAFALKTSEQEQRLTVEIAKGVVVDSPVLVTDMIMDGNLGQPFLSQYVITLDLGASRMWIAAREE